MTRTCMLARKAPPKRLLHKSDNNPIVPFIWVWMSVYSKCFALCGFVGAKMLHTVIGATDYNHTC